MGNTGSFSTQTVAQIAAFVGLLICLGNFLRHRLVRGANSALPPGPPGNWLVGTKIPSKNPHLQLEEWTQKYGPVYSFRRGLNTVVIIGRYEPAVEIMEKEGASLNDRPLSIAAGEILSGGMRTLLVPSGPRLKKLRRALHAQLQEKAAVEYEPVQLVNAKNVVLDILRDPDHHQDHAKRYAASVIISLTYGKPTPTTYSEPEVQRLQKCLFRLGAAVRPGTYLVDSFPPLRYVPGYLSELKRYHQEELSLFRSQLDGVRDKINKGADVQPCFAKYLIENQEQFGLTDNEAAYLAGSMFGAGADTTAAAISIAIMAAAKYPDVQTRVQEELDRVVGLNRYPTFADQPSLPFTTAFFFETYRWRPVSVTGFAHRATRDIVWRNYHIPKGSTVIGSHWSIFKDPDVFPNPETFDPSRWIDNNGNIKDYPKNFNFGFGRRVCVGHHVANRSVFINTALLLWAFRILENPKSPIDITAFTSTANIHPLPFEANFEPRQNPEEIKRLLRGE
ncbi:cytochrome P450 [Dendrothele bispora CBS 962.96]|uniref:Cytochrome P450 n=1 Tax=Dendrothele bispora (strain CBS 962.96) TaxID=1314807 RepID=A0A4S8MV89_DENBC|nr:cytochrome P450 [Dendrothele bispora CBS 962.96]